MSVVIRELHIAWLNFLRRSTGCCLSLLSPMKKSTGSDAMIQGDRDHGSGVFIVSGVGGGCGGWMDRSGMLSAGDAVALGNVHSDVLVRVIVSSDSDGKELKLLRLVLLNEI